MNMLFLLFKTKVLKFHYYAPPGLGLCGEVVHPGLKPGVTDVTLLRSLIVWCGCSPRVKTRG
jgi:hypothetical protein